MMSATLLTGCDQKIVVGIAELAASNTEHVTLTTDSPGTCPGIAVNDPAIKAGGPANRSMPLHPGTGEVRLKTSGLPRDISLCRNSMTI